MLKKDQLKLKLLIKKMLMSYIFFHDVDGWRKHKGYIKIADIDMIIDDIISTIEYNKAI